MLIDPFTTFAQILNFVVLVFLLKKFLYKPITNAMEQREKNIMSRLEEAETTREAAQKEAEYYRHKQQEWEENKQNRLEQIKKEAEQQKHKLMREAKVEIEMLRQQWYEQLQREKQQFLGTLKQKANQQIMKLSRQTLQELANADLQQQMINKFIQGLPQLTHNEVLKHDGINNEKQEACTIRSTFTISDQQKKQLTQALKQQFDRDIKLNFEMDKDSICGIELLNHGYKIPWNLDHYLDELESKISQSLEGENNVTR